MAKEEDLFWTILQDELCLFVPDFIKNILNAFDYNSASMIRLIDDTKISSIENFVKNDLSFLIDGENIDKKIYYGVFHKNIEKFKFFEGQRDMLKLLSDCINKKVGELGDKNGILYFHKRDKSETVNERLVRQNRTKKPLETVERPIDEIEINKLSSLLLLKLKASLKNKNYSTIVSILF